MGDKISRLPASYISLPNRLGSHSEIGLIRCGLVERRGVFYMMLCAAGTAEGCRLCVNQGAKHPIIYPASQRAGQPVNQVTRDPFPGPLLLTTRGAQPPARTAYSRHSTAKSFKREPHYIVNLGLHSTLALCWPTQRRQMELHKYIHTYTTVTST